MNFVIPMAGKGQRFVDAGYEKPKMLIEANGKTLLEWSIDSLPLSLCSNLIFILLEDHDKRHNIINFIKEKYEGKTMLQFVKLIEPTRGQAETVLKAKSIIDMDKDLIIFNIDTFFESSKLKCLLKENTSDGILGAFVDHSDSTKYSYAKIGKDGYVIEVAEKTHIADYALTGFYHFKRPQDFIFTAEKEISIGNTTKGEFYIAPMYNNLMKQGKRFILDICDKYAILGTPEELKSFVKDSK